MKVVYIAGKFRGRSAWEVHQNVLRAEAASLRVAELGAMPLCPHKNTEHFDGLLKDEFWIEGTKELLRRSDALWVFDPAHAEASVGTRGELEEAAARQIPAFFGDLGLRELRTWLARPTKPERCTSTSPEGIRCVLLAGHEDHHQATGIVSTAGWTTP